MRILDKLLFILASLSLLGVVAILAAGEVSPRYISSAAFRNSVSAESVNSESALVEFSPEPEQGLVPAVKEELQSEQGMQENIVILNREIDQAIENYFETIRQHPEALEEENRLVTEESGVEPEDEADESPQKKSGKVNMVRHTVQKGESVWRIAQTYNVPVYSIVSVNPLKSKSIIQPGDELQIPDRKGVGYKIKNGETLAGIAAKFKSDIEKIKEANGLTESQIIAGDQLFIPGAKPLPETIYVNKKRFIWPVKGRLTSGYGWRKHPIYNGKNFHSGIDIGAPWGTSIMAAASGVVVFAGNGGGYGNMILIKHKDDYFSVYAHASKLHVKKGQYVKQGQRIAKVGNTGLSTGSHLHFEIKKGRKVVNPATALKLTVKVAKKNT